jgi:hypothetical protein
LIVSTQNDDAQQQIGRGEVGSSGIQQDAIHQSVGQGAPTSDGNNEDSHVVQHQNVISEEEGSSSVQPGNSVNEIKGILHGNVGKVTDAGKSTYIDGDDLNEAQKAPNVIKIKCVKRKYWMLHRDDDQWHQYSREMVDKVAGTVSVNGITI